ncbi:MAG TPA: peptide chain release factor-like protein [bacterium]|nr:peptide chain release factor-like protein [bacterium]
MPLFPVSPEKQAQLEERMARLGLRESDLIEDFVKGSGAGGQKINKTSMAVSLQHRPSGLMVRCQESRSQALNRFLARRLMCDKLEEKILGARSAERQRQEKIRRQKRKRSKRAKEKMLSDKHHHAEKKDFRRRPDF